MLPTKNFVIMVVSKVPVAVRTSATAEDSADASFAGQGDTFLNVVEKLTSSTG